jgi:hypothetical protein
VRLLMALIAGGLAASAVAAQADAPQIAPAAAAVPASEMLATEKGGGATHAVPHSERAEWFYAARFGVDQMHIKYTASGASLEFRYRVVDPDKAAILTDKRATPYLFDQKSGVRLMVPTMEKIGALRQEALPEVGREYWMAFSNPGKIVQRGNRVDVKVGYFQVRGLVVE